MRFTTGTGRVLEWDKATGLTGDPLLVEQVQFVIDEGIPCGCNYWGEIEPSLDTPWQAYLTVCGALAHIFAGVEPKVDGVPNNPAGYEPEGPVQAKPLPESVRRARRYARPT